MTKSIEFYRKKLQMPLRFSSPDWTEFETGVTTLALRGGCGPAHHYQGEVKPAGCASLCFNVTDVQVAYDELEKRGVPFSLPPSVRPDEGIKLAIALDPDGLEISFIQLLNK